MKSGPLELRIPNWSQENHNGILLKPTYNTYQYICGNLTKQLISS